MKRLHFTITVLLLVITAWAAPVSRQQAQQQAEAFLSNRGATLKGNLKMTVKRVRPSVSGDAAYYYVFNADNQKGFVVVSGDDRTAPILGYADSGEITEEAMPANMRAWLEGYAEQMKWMDEHGYNNTATRHAQARRAIRNPIGPLLTTKWNQDAPYNLLCPTYNGEQTVTGCVATAMAQMMYYHQMPAKTTKQIPAYRTETNYLSIAAIPVTTFDWANMKDTYASSTDQTNAANKAVATLMKCVGAAVEMDYDIPPGGSGASSTAIPTALINYFGYDKDIKQADRNDYTYAEWVDMIYNELSRGPVVYCGQSMGGGHAFVCDGYAEDDFFHINWGWGGSSDGYFKLSVLSPENQGIGGSSTDDGFSFMQDALINVRPQDNGTTDTFDATTIGTANIDVALELVGKAYYDKQTTVKATLYNNDSETYSGDLYLYEYINDTYNLLSALQIEDVAPGQEQTVQFLFTPTHTGSTSLMAVDKIGYIVGEATITVTNAPSGNLSVTNSTITGLTSEKVYGNRVTGTVTIKNSSSIANSDGIYIGLADYDEGYYVQEKTFPATIPANGTATVPFEFDNLTYSDLHVIAFLEPNANFSSTFTPTPGVALYKADGTKTFSAPASTVKVASDVVTLDISELTTVSSVTPNSNPNTLYILNPGKTTPSSLNGKNVVKGGVAASLNLTDGYPFFSPISFTATTATYTRQFDSGINLTDGWSTLVLPFDVQVVAQGERQLQAGTDYWLMELSDETDSSISFDNAEMLTANHPYIMGVTGSEWGTARDLTQQAITFTGTNVTIDGSAHTAVTGDYFKMGATYTTRSINNAYLLNDNGNAFVKKSTATVAPFRAYVTARQATTANSLPIGTTITPVVNPDDQPEDLVSSPVTPPVDLQTTDYTFSAIYRNNSGTSNIERTVQVGFDGNDVYISGISYYLQNDAWLKGKLNADRTTITLQSPQYYGIYNEQYNLYFIANEFRGNDDDTYPTTTQLGYDAATGEITVPDYLCILESQQPVNEWNCIGYYYAISLTKGEAPAPEVVTIPDGLEAEQYIITYSDYNGSAQEGTVNVAFDDTDVYIQGLCQYLPEAWLKGNLIDDDDEPYVYFPGQQYFGKYEDYDFFFQKYNTALNYDKATGTLSTSGVIYTYYDNYYSDYYDSPVIKKAETSTSVNTLSERPRQKTYFDLQGRRVTNPAKGSLYIVDGKKTVRR